MVAALVPELEALPAMLNPSDDRVMHQWSITRRAMACDFTVLLHPLVAEPLAAANLAFAEIEALEELLSVYRPSSEMCRVNRHAFERPVRADGRLFELLERSAELARRTQGAFDVATGAMIRAWGFFDGNRRVPSPAEHAAALAACGMQHVTLEKADSVVRYQVPGLEVNLGSIGKGYAIDRAMRRMREEAGIDCALMIGGTSSMCALGSPWGDDNGWLIAIEDPDDTSRSVATVRLRNRAIGTSSAASQFFDHEGRRYGHLLDPRTGRPAEQVASASAIAADAATADALATAFFVLGLDKTAEFCQNHADVAALIVLRNGEAGRPADSPAAQPPGPASRANSRVVTFNLSSQDVKTATGMPPRG
jgi:thiamine biosynthesis lipoprotein